MAFNNEARKRLQKFVQTARNIIEDDFKRQLQGVFGMDAETGNIVPLSALKHLTTTDYETASDLREIFEHYKLQDKTDDDQAVLQRMLREQTQTFLARICALRMAEARHVLMPSVTDGMRSAGFVNYRFVVGAGLGTEYQAYEKYLKSQFDELAVDLPQIFDRTQPYGLLFASEQAFMQFLAEVSAGDLEPFWAEDETIGWIYQYFNNGADFAMMRGQKNKTPKNSHELAVRNQFFTPRYVVEFLLDNTLGRLWVQEVGNKGHLAERLSSLVLDQSKEVKNKNNVPRDPRTLRVLDPACGSMHFGLYAFDLLEAIYEDCWDWLKAHPGKRLNTEGKDGELIPFAQLADDKEGFLKKVPGLILANNIYGVDIDIRATQIASLALWLRAQKSLDRLGVLIGDPSRSLGRGHVVAAVAPPPENDIAEVAGRRMGVRASEGLKALKLDFLNQVPETGLLLPLERDLEQAVAWSDETSEGMLPGMPADWAQMDLPLDTSSRWMAQKEAVTTALNGYLEGIGHSFREKLFAVNAVQCLNLLDLCTKHFDVIVMNPPFGAPADGSKDLLGGLYPLSKRELSGMFVMRMLELAKPHGYVGAITSRTIFFQGSSEDWRRRLLSSASMPVFADLGPGVMDDAMVEAAAYVVSPEMSKVPTLFINATNPGNRADCLKNYQNYPSLLFKKTLINFIKLPGCVFAYQTDPLIIEAYKGETLDDVADVKVGLQTGDNDRFVRLYWEIEGAKKSWVPLAKGGPTSPFYGEVSTDINWQKNGAEIWRFSGSVLRNVPYYFRPGLTWSFRGNSLALRVFPSEGIFDRVGDCVFVAGDDEENLLVCLAILNSRAYQNFMSLQLQRVNQASHYECGMLSVSPYPTLNSEEKSLLASLAKQNYEARRRLASVNEESRYFVLPEWIAEANGDLDREAELATIKHSQDEMDRLGDQLYGFESRVIDKQEKSREVPTPSQKEKLNRLLSWAVGVAFGRFDLRLAIGDRVLPDLGAPFAPYPKLAPGRLPEGDAPFIPNKGIFAMDPGNSLDLTRAVERVLSECGLSDVADVEDWLENTFPALHLKMYRGAQRVAPIYWPIGTNSGSYTLWLYYPKLSKEMLFTAVSDFVDPKMASEKQTIEEIQKIGEKTSAEQRKEAEESSEFLAELSVFRSQLLDLASNAVFHPDDGVAINAVRFMPMIQNRAWLKTLEKVKLALEKGDLDWSETAADLYPDRVRRACEKDPSIRAAHAKRFGFSDESGVTE
ncbi:MAG: hypothetical protein ACFWTZ_07225 [Burkholderia sp.]|jgi:hypothetical protein